MIQEIDAGAEFVHAFARRRPVSYAFWLEDEEAPYPYLYIVPDGVDDDGIFDAYGDVVDVGKELDSPYLDPFRVKLVTSQNPIARSVAELFHRYPTVMNRQDGHKIIGAFSVPQGGVYPYFLPVTAA